MRSNHAKSEKYFNFHLTESNRGPKFSVCYIRGSSDR